MTLLKKYFQSKEILVGEVQKRLGAGYELKEFAYSPELKQVVIPANSQGQDLAIVVKRYKKVPTFLGILLMAVMIVGSLFIWQQSQLPKENILPAALAPEMKDAKEIDKEELMKRMQKKVDEGYVNLQMNTEVIFNQGDGFGTIQAVNPEENQTVIAFDIFLADSDEILYSSGSISPGQYINKGKLNRTLKKGTYEAYAAVKMFDEETQKELNASKVVLSIVVNS